jgi:hypothetical protein
MRTQCKVSGNIIRLLTKSEIRPTHLVKFRKKSLQLWACFGCIGETILIIESREWILTNKFEGFPTRRPWFSHSSRTSRWVGPLSSGCELRPHDIEIMMRHFPVNWMSNVTVSKWVFNFHCTPAPCSCIRSAYTFSLFKSKISPHCHCNAHKKIKSPRVGSPDNSITHVKSVFILHWGWLCVYRGWRRPASWALALPEYDSWRLFFVIDNRRSV